MEAASPLEALRAEVAKRGYAFRSLQSAASIARFTSLAELAAEDEKKAAAEGEDKKETPAEGEDGEAPVVKFHLAEKKALPWGVDGEEELAQKVLVARQNNIAHAADMYCAIMKWREEQHADTILDTPDPNEQFYQYAMPHRFHGHDKEGHPVYLERTGPISCRMHEYLKTRSEHDLIVRHIRWQEIASDRLRHASAHFQRHISKVVIIFDMTGTSMSVNPGALRVFKAVLGIDAHYYPERLKRFFLINANWMFRGIWAMVSPWLDEVTRGKIEILGGDYQSRLLQEIDPHELPVEYGGTCACGFDGMAQVEGKPSPCFAPIRKYPPEHPQPPVGFGLSHLKGPQLKGRLLPEKQKRV